MPENLHHPYENISTGRRVRDFLSRVVLGFGYMAPVFAPEMHEEFMARQEAARGPNEVEQYLKNQAEGQ